MQNSDAKPPIRWSVTLPNAIEGGQGLSLQLIGCWQAPPLHCRCVAMVTRCPTVVASLGAPMCFLLVTIDTTGNGVWLEVVAMVTGHQGIWLAVAGATIAVSLMHWGCLSAEGDV